MKNTNETGMTPKQLQTQNAELLKALRELYYQTGEDDIWVEFESVLTGRAKQSLRKARKQAKQAIKNAGQE